jgi:SAM-dependent methyltransferase
VNTPEQIQAEYYKRTASSYAAMHVDEGDEHFTALGMIDALCEYYGIKSILDVGSGTGRAVKFLHDRGRVVRGIEPIQALIDQSELAPLIQCGSGDALPYADHSFDAVIECGVLHHVADPSRIVSEMTRVARKAVFLSDANRFGEGGFSRRLLKLALWKLLPFETFRLVASGGKGYTITEGDGLAYSYSVYDSFAQSALWASQAWVMPTRGGDHRSNWLSPLLTHSHVLLCAVKG